MQNRALRVSFLGLAASLALASCADEAPAPWRPAPAARVALRPTGAPLDFAPVLAARHAPSPGLAPWTIAEGEGKLTDVAVETADPEAPAASEAMVRVGGERTRLFVPVDPAQRFNRVELRVHSPGNQLKKVQVLCFTGSKRCAVSDTALVEPKPGIQTLTFDLPELDGVELVDRVALQAFGFAGEFDLGAFDLIRRPHRAWLPDAGAGPQHVDLATDMRLGVGLSSLAPLEGGAALPPGAHLAFSYGVPYDLRAPGELELAVRVRAKDGAELEQVFAIRPEKGPAAWNSVDLALGELAGPGGAGEVAVRFELRSELGREDLCAIAEPTIYVPMKAPRTVLLVTSDTHRGDHVGGALRAADVRTPVLDALAARGVFFEEAWSTINLTNPSHIAMLTGVHPRDVGIFDNATRLAENAPTLAEAFAAAGYATWAATSAVHLGPTVSGLEQGFDRFSAPARPQRPIAETLAVLEPWLAERTGQPLFVWLHVFDVHGPHKPPEEYAARHWPAERDPYDPSLPDVGIPPAALKKHKLEGLRDPGYQSALYRAEVDYLDVELGRVFSETRFQDAVIGLTGDHGESFGQHGIFFCHAGLYPDTIHVPLVLAFPGAPAGLRVSQRVSNLDLGRTLLDLANLAASEFPGQNLMRAVESPERFDPIFTSGEFDLMAAITKGKWHLIVTLQEYPRAEFARPRARHETELFDLAADPGCTRDLFEQETAVARELRAELAAWLAGARELGWDSREELSGATFEALEELGYVGGESGDADAAGMRASEDGDAPFGPDCACDWCRRLEPE